VTNLSFSPQEILRMPSKNVKTGLAQKNLSPYFYKKYIRTKKGKGGEKNGI